MQFAEHAVMPLVRRLRDDLERENQIKGLGRERNIRNRSLCDLPEASLAHVFESGGSNIETIHVV